MPTSAQIEVSATVTDLPTGGGMLRCEARRFSADGHRTKARVDNDVADQASRRLGTLAILTACTVVGMTIVQQALQPELAIAHQAPLFRLSALFLVLASAGLAILQRSQLVQAQLLLDLGLVFEVAGAFALGAMENSLPWADHAVRGSTGVSAWIALCVLAIPNRPWKSCTAAVLSAAMVPCAHLVSAHVLGYHALPWHRLASYSLTPFFVAGWTPFISTRLHEMQKELSRTQELGSYRLERLLGRGGMGEVWRARHRLLRREAAVKLVLPGLLSRSGAAASRHVRQRFELEAQSIASLRSPHTVALYDFGTSDEGSLYYAMELLDGMDVETLVEQHGAQPASRVLYFIQQACESLEEAHDQGMVHRDIKPSNVFVCRLGNRTDFVKLLDFGLVKALYGQEETRLTIQGEASGTPAFMAPEQVRGELDIDGRADIYGLGCVAYFLLTGTLVFEAPTPMAMALAHVEQAPEPPSRRSELPIPASLERVVVACLAKDRQQRPQSVAELSGLLDGCTDVPTWTQAEARHWWSLHLPEPGEKASA